MNYLDDINSLIRQLYTLSHQMHTCTQALDAAGKDTAARFMREAGCAVMQSISSLVAERARIAEHEEQRAVCS